MNSTAKSCLILNYRKTAKSALNVIAGALQTHASTTDIPIYFAKNNNQLLEQINIKLAQNLIPIVAWSFYSPSFVENAQNLSVIKQHIQDNQLIHLAGGVHATAEPVQTLQAGFDYVAIGEGKQIIVDFMQAIETDTNPKLTKGISWLENGQFKRNGRGKFIDLNDYPPCATKYRKFGPIEITRGCVFACRFCQTPHVNKARFRHRSLDNICHYVQIMKDYKLKDYRFITPTSFSYGAVDEGVNLLAIEELLARIRSIIGPDRRIFYGTFPSEIRPEHISLTALGILKKYVNNNNIIIEGQSGSDNVLQAIRRGHSVEEVRRAVRLTVEAGFIPNVDFLFGLPEETQEDAQQSIDFATELADLGARIHTHTFMPLPGTPLRYAKTGTINQQTKETLIQLESTGKAYGQWKNQQKIAVELQSLQSEKIEF